MKLISESIERPVKFITEENQLKGKTYFIEGVFLQAEIKNKNGRVYPLSIMSEAVKTYNETFIKQSRAFGELGHPNGPTINLDRVSHMIQSLTNVGNDFIGRAKILDTPNGRIVKNLLDEGAKLAVSSRGLGSIKEKNEVQYVENDFFIATAADIVADPSAPSAFINGIMEGREFLVTERGEIKPFDPSKIQETIEKTSKRDLQEAYIREFNKFLRMLSGKSQG